MMSDLAEAIGKLKSHPHHQEMVERYGEALHDIFESILTTALMENPGESIDGAAILATLMRCFKEVSKQPQPVNPIVPQLQGLPSERYGRNTNT